MADTCHHTLKFNKLIQDYDTSTSSFLLPQDCTSEMEKIQIKLYLDLSSIFRNGGIKSMNK